MSGSLNSLFSPTMFLPENALYTAGQNGGTQPGSNPPSGANWGPTDAGLNGLSVGRSGLAGAFGLGGIGATIANQGLNTALGAAIPGAGIVSGIGNAFNGGVAGLQSQNAQSQATGISPGFGQSVGAFLGGAMGLSTTGLGGYGPANMGGMAGMENSMDPGTSFGRAASKTMADNYAATGNINTASQAQAPTGFGFSAQGGGLSGLNSDVSVNAPSAMAFGGNFAGTPSMGQDASGTNMAGGEPGANFGGLGQGDQATANSNSEGSQGGGGANGDSQGGGANGGGGGGGGDAYHNGGPIHGDAHDFRGRSGMIHEGVIHGAAGGQDNLHVEAPVGGYVVPRDVVAIMGRGDAKAGAHAIMASLPPAKHTPVPMTKARVEAHEVLIHPAHVTALGDGDHAAGVARLHAMIEAVRGRR